MGFWDAKIDWWNWLEIFKSLFVGCNQSRIWSSPESQLVLLPLEMNIPLAECPPFPALWQRPQSYLLTPRCSLNVGNLLVLVLLTFLTTFSIVRSRHVFPLGFCDIMHFRISCCFSGYSFTGCFSFAVAILLSLAFFRYTSEIHFGGSYLFPPQGLGTNLFPLPGFLLPSHFLNEAYPDPHYPSHIPELFFFS